MTSHGHHPDGVKILRGSGMIEGVQVVPLRRIPDERGTIYHMMKSTDAHFSAFGEIYFSTLYRGVVKGWHKHGDMTLNYACISGSVKVVLYDDREQSPTNGGLVEAFIGPDAYSLIVIPPGVWNGMKGMTDPLAIVANCATHPHDPARSARVDPFDNGIPYTWDTRHE